jgi:hypothetical protein
MPHPGSLWAISIISVDSLQVWKTVSRSRYLTHRFFAWDDLRARTGGCRQTWGRRSYCNATSCSFRGQENAAGKPGKLFMEDCLPSAYRTCSSAGQKPAERIVAYKRLQTLDLKIFVSVARFRPGPPRIKQYVDIACASGKPYALKLNLSFP